MNEELRAALDKIEAAARNWRDHAEEARKRGDRSSMCGEEGIPSHVIATARAMSFESAAETLRAALSQPRQEDGLEAAWAAAEAALPEDSGMWLIQGVQLVDTSDSEDLIDEQLEWEAEAVDHRRGGQPWNVTALGPTPAAALRALAARLAAEGSDEGSKP